jgi:predicted naringenin-chalcone synthase
MDNHIVSIGTANPGAPISQSRISNFMKKAHGLDPQESRKINFVYNKSGIATRHSVIRDFEFDNPEEYKFFPNNEALEPFPSTKQRMSLFKDEALGLAIEAIENCLKAVKVIPEEVTHLVLVSCTGMFAPGLELEIMRQLGIKSNVERYSIHFMGCYAAFNAIKLADRICDSQQDAKVLLVSVELCTIHFQKVYTEDNVLANAIFGDGAAAALVCKGNSGLSIRNYHSQLFPDTENDMAWSIGDFGFEMKLSKYVPDLLGKGLHQIRQHLESMFSLSGIKNFAIHPGGKQILHKVEEAFKINKEQNLHSHEVLHAFGNMSSATILFVLEKWLLQTEKTGPILALGFGPGLTLETLLLEK